MKLCWNNSYLIFDEDQMSYDYSWILENIGSVNLYTFDFCILGLTTMQSLCCQNFVKYKGVILTEK